MNEDQDERGRRFAERRRGRPYVWNRGEPYERSGFMTEVLQTARDGDEQ